jgi:beta-N-acetylhexosaminidase
MSEFIADRGDQGLRRLAVGTLLAAFQGTEAPDWVLRELENGLGGVTLFGFNVADAAQLSALTSRLREAADPVISLDEEGGDVTRLSYHVGSPYPGNAALGAVDDVELTRRVYRSIGDDLARCGVNLDMAPSADVNTAADNPVIGTRSFGAETALVARHTVAAVHGLQSAGVAACVKHFPGHGATRQDSHLEVPLVDASVELLRERELVPFRAAIEAGTRSIMTAHVRVPAVTGALPATLSPAALTGLLRGEMGYEGVVITDALDMKAISAGVGHAEGAVRALAAGADLLCIGNPGYPEAYDAAERLDLVVDAVVAAVEQGRLTMERLEQGAARVDALRAWLREEPDGAIEDASDVAAQAVTRRGDVRVDRPRVVDLGGAVNIAAGDRDRHLREALEAHAGDGRFVVLARHPSQLAEAADLVDQHPDAVVVWSGIDLEVPGDHVVLTHGGGRAVAEAAAALILGEAR